MKKTLTIIVAVLVSLTGVAQTFTCSPNDSIVQNIDANATAVLKIEQVVSDPNDTIQLEIEVIYNDIPSGWDGMLCIQGLCTGQIAPVGTSGIPMTPTDSNLNGYTRLTLSPLGNTGTIKYQVYVYDVDYPNDGDTATWILTSLDMTGINEVQSDDLPMVIYPNPASSEFNVEFGNSEIASVNIYSISGCLVRTLIGTSNNSEKLDVSDLKAGIYLVEAMSNSGLFGRKQIIIE